MFHWIVIAILILMCIVYRKVLFGTLKVLVIVLGVLCLIGIVLQYI